jgi:branched-chain amino acid transport system permease protein
MSFIQSVLLPLSIDAVLLAGIYILASLGLSLVFGVMEVVNFAHGILVMIGGYLAYTGFQQFGISPLVGLIAIIPAMFALGYVLEVGTVEYVLGDNEIYSLLMTFGLALVFQGLLQEIYSTTTRSIVYLSYSINVLGTRIAMNKLVTGVLGYLFAAVLFLFLSYSKFGRAIRATSQASDLAEACGINAPRIRAAAFGIGTMLAGVGGTLYVMVYQISPIGGRSLLLIGFVIIVLGGMGSLRGTAIAGLIVGFIQIFVTYFVGSHATFFVLYVGIAAILLVRPYGLFGEPEARHG